MNCNELKNKIYKIVNKLYDYVAFLSEYNLEWGVKWDDYD